MEIYELSYPAKARGVQRRDITAGDAVAEFDELKKELTLTVARDGKEFVVRLVARDIIQMANHVHNAVVVITRPAPGAIETFGREPGQ